MRYRRPIATVAAALIVGAALTGCSAINSFLHDTFPDQFGPQRDAEGRVSAAVDAHVTYLETGDCFSFVDPADRTEVTIIPCAQEHAFEVIGQGEVTLQEEKTLGIQTAVSAKCAEPFATFKAAAPEGSQPDQEFLISERKEGERTGTQDSCTASLSKL